MFLQNLFSPPDINRLKAEQNVPGLIKALRYSKDNGIRQRSAEVLGEFKAAQAIKPLCRATEDESTDVRLKALEALGKIRDARAVGTLCAALSDWLSEVQKTAALSLILIGAPAVNALCVELKSTNPSARQLAAEALGKIGDSGAVKPLCAALSDAKSEVRLAARLSLTQIGVPAVRALCVELKSTNRNARQLAAEALGTIGDNGAVGALSAALSNVESEVQWAALSSLSQIGVPAMEALSAALKGTNLEVRQFAARSLERIGVPAIEPLSAALKDADPEVRVTAGLSLMTFIQIAFGDPSVDWLCSALRNPDPEEQQLAATFLESRARAFVPRPQGRPARLSNGNCNCLKCHEIRQEIGDLIAQQARALRSAETLNCATGDDIDDAYSKIFRDDHLKDAESLGKTIAKRKSLLQGHLFSVDGSVFGNYDEIIESALSVVDQTNDPGELSSIAGKAALDNLLDAVDRLDDSAKQIIAIAFQHPRVRSAAVRKLADQSLLSAIALSDGEATVRESATANLIDQSLLKTIALNDTDAKVRATAIAQLTSTAELREALSQSLQKFVIGGASQQVHSPKCYVNHISSHDWSENCNVCKCGFRPSEEIHTYTGDDGHTVAHLKQVGPRSSTLGRAIDAVPRLLSFVGASCVLEFSVHWQEVSASGSSYGTGTHTYSHLFLASSSGNFRMVQLLLAGGASVNTRGRSDDGTALHAAARNGHFEVAEILLKNGADVNAFDSHHTGRTPSFFELREAHGEVLALLRINGGVVSLK